jgi:hypothetical protein
MFLVDRRFRSWYMPVNILSPSRKCELSLNLTLARLAKPVSYACLAGTIIPWLPPTLLGESEISQRPKLGLIVRLYHWPDLPLGHQIDDGSAGKLASSRTSASRTLRSRR